MVDLNEPVGDVPKVPIVPPEENKPVQPSLVEEVKAMRDEFLKAKDELKEEREKLEKVQADNLLSSSAGGRIEPPKISENEKKIEDAKEYWKGTQLEKDIIKANE